MESHEQYTVFAGTTRMAQGDLNQVASAVRSILESGDTRSVLVFGDRTGSQVDIDLRGVTDEMLARYGSPKSETGPESPPPTPQPRRPGRPKLGVVGREITLLPRHWEWLNVQPGGASVALRKLVEMARRESRQQDRVRRSRDAAYRFMSALAGNEPGFEEACRALFAGNGEAFEQRMRDWPADVREFAHGLAADAFGGDEAS